MHIFLDESGTDKQHGKSSVALVCIATDRLSLLQSSILSIEHKLGIVPFHWSKSSWDIRQRFIKAVAREEFSIRAALIKNPFDPEYAYISVVKNLLVGSDVHSLVIDGRKSRSYERRLKKAIRDKGISIKKLRTANDLAFPALRLADAVAGIIRYHADFPTHRIASLIYKKISRKIFLVLEP